MRTVAWHAGKVRLIDQRLLPWELAFVELDSHEAVALAITDMVVRGADSWSASHHHIRCAGHHGYGGARRSSYRRHSGLRHGAGRPRMQGRGLA